MTDLNQINAFVSVVRYGGFTKAAAQLGEPKSTLSRKVSELESRLGTSLLIRTTRSLRLTDAGTAFFDECSRALAELDAAEKTLLPQQLAMAGVIRMTAPVEVGTYLLAGLMKEFTERHPKISFELDLSDRYVDLLREGFDVALRAGHLKNSSLRAKKLGVGCFALFASPLYLKKNGVPKTPRDVCEHRGLVFSPEFRELPWIVQNKTKKEKILPSSQIKVNSLSMAKNLALAGAGICYVPSHIVTPETQNRLLVPVLPEWVGDLKPYYLVYPHAQIYPSRLRLWIDFVSQNLII